MKEEILYEILDDNFDIDSIERWNREGRWSAILDEFAKSGRKQMRFTLHSEQEKGRCYAAVLGYRKAKKLDWTVFCERHTYNIYIVRA